MYLKVLNPDTNNKGIPKKETDVENKKQDTKYLPLHDSFNESMFFIPKSYLTDAEFRDHMFKLQLNSNKEFWPTTLQRENEGIYLRIVAGPGSKIFSAAIGSKIRVLSPSHTWRKCTVIESASKRLKVTYDGFSSEFDEWIDQSSDRLSKDSLKNWGSKSMLDIQLSISGGVSADETLLSSLPEYATNATLTDQGITCNTMYGPYELSTPNRSVSLPFFTCYDSLKF